MPKLILTSRYIRNSPSAQLKNYIRYISTREGVEKIDESKLHLPITRKQDQLIHQLLRDMPQTKQMLEYRDFCLHPTIGSASEFISCALEQNLDLIGKRQNYVDYIATRPRVERIGEHGLFTDAGLPVVISNVQEDVASHKGPVWTHVISLRREDAARLGYDSGEQWRDLLRSKRAMLCKHMKIDSANLRWYASFHNESHHPHIHLMVYSAKDNDGFLTEKSIESMRSELAHDIFRQDFAHIYEEQNQARNTLKQESKRVIEERIRQIETSMCDNPMIRKQMVELSKRLQNTRGKKVYGYLKRDVKTMVDRIVDELAKEPSVAKLYKAWGEWRNELLKTYQDKLPSLLPLSKQPQFKSIKNMVITEAMNLGGHHFTFEDEAAADLPESEAEREFLQEEPESLDESKMQSEPKTKTEAEKKIFRAEWSAQYKMAHQYLYGSDIVKQNFDEAFRVFLSEAESGNALAMYDLGRMFADGLGCEMDMMVSYEWYRKALDAYHVAVLSAEERQLPYLQYRIGQMFHIGIGTEKDDKAAEMYWERSARLGNINAQYALGKLWLENRTGEPGKAIAWITKAVEGGNTAAQYALAKFYRDGEFVARDLEKAIRLFTLSAEKNDYAAYSLGKLYLLEEDIARDIEKAVKYLSLSADQGNHFAQYALGKLYLCGYDVPRDKEKAVPLLESSAAQGNIYAQFLLDHLDSYYDPSVLLTATRLMHRLGSIFQEDYHKEVGGGLLRIDQKRRRRLREKKQAQGHAYDDREQQI